MASGPGFNESGPIIGPRFGQIGFALPGFESAAEIVRDLDNRRGRGCFAVDRSHCVSTTREICGFGTDAVTRTLGSDGWIATPINSGRAIASIFKSRGAFRQKAATGARRIRSRTHLFSVGFLCFLTWAAQRRGAAEPEVPHPDAAARTRIPWLESARALRQWARAARSGSSGCVAGRLRSEVDARYLRNARSRKSRSCGPFSFCWREEPLNDAISRWDRELRSVNDGTERFRRPRARAAARASR